MVSQQGQVEEDADPGLADEDGQYGDNERVCDVFRFDHDVQVLTEWDGADVAVLILQECDELQSPSIKRCVSINWMSYSTHHIELLLWGEEIPRNHRTYVDAVQERVHNGEEPHEKP